jgi:hypothetical protein
MKNYGYKVCYIEENGTEYIRRFKTYTRKQARYSMDCYVRYPTEDDGRRLKNPTWKIIPITRNEVLAGIWREPPF